MDFPKPVWSDVVGREVITTTVERSSKITIHGQRKVTTTVLETTEQPYVILSCGHQVRGVDFDSRGKDRKRIQCFDCTYKTRIQPVEQKTGSEA